jgi:hypothetical protein
LVAAMRANVRQNSLPPKSHTFEESKTNAE